MTSSQWHSPDPDDRVELAPPARYNDSIKAKEEREGPHLLPTFSELVNVGKALRYSGVALVALVAVVGLRSYFGGSAAVNERLVTAIVFNPGTATASGGAVVVDGENGLVVAGVRGDDRHGDFYTVILDHGHQRYAISTIELARSQGGVLLQLVGLDTMPVLSKVIEDLGSNRVGEDLGGSLDILLPQEASVEGGRVTEKVNLTMPAEGDTIPLDGKMQQVGSWEMLFNGRSVSGTAIVGCEDGKAVARVTPMGDLAAAIRDAQDGGPTHFVGPAPYPYPHDANRNHGDRC